MNIKPIKTKKDYEQAMLRLEKLFDAKKELAKEEFTTDRQINFCNIDEAKTEVKSSLSFTTSNALTEVWHGLHPARRTNAPAH